MKKILLYLFLIALSLAQTVQAAILFEPIQTRLTGSKPNSIAIADLNGDGRNDVVLMTEEYVINPHNDNNILIFYQNVNGTFLDPVRYAGWPEQVFVLGDVNGDGRIDIIIAKPNGIGVLYQNTDGTFQPIQIIAGPKSSVIRTGDINNDGRLDIVSLSGNDNLINLYVQNPDGSIPPPVSIPYPYPYGLLALSDLNNDGFLDIAVLSNDGLSPNLGILYQLEGGAFSAPTFVDLEGNEIVTTMAIGDVNNDGLNDVILSLKAEQVAAAQTAIFHQKAEGGFMPPVILPSPFLNDPDHIYVNDLNLDGRVDIIEYFGGRSAIRLQKADGTFESPQILEDPYAFGSPPAPLAIGDLNGDGRPDIAMVKQNGYSSGFDIAFQSNKVCSYALSQTSLTIVPGQTTEQIGLTTNYFICPWAVTSNNDWITIISQPSGEGTMTTVRFSVSANLSGSQRTGTISIAGQVLTVIQPACTYTLFNNHSNFYYAGGSGSIYVSVNDTSCPLQATSNDPSWITVSNLYLPVTFNVSANASGAPRTGSISIGGQTYTVYQSQQLGAGGEWKDLWGSVNDRFITIGAISTDGRVLAGGDHLGRAVSWTPSGGVRNLMSGGFSSAGATALSADGSVIVGFATDPSWAQSFKWTAQTGMIPLETLNPLADAYAVATGISSDGMSVVGYEYDYWDDTHGAVLWKPDGKPVYLGTLPGGFDNSFASAISADGKVIVGYAHGVGQPTRAFRWTQATGMTDLGTLPGGGGAWANGVSADGSVIVGGAGNTAGSTRAFRWTQATGMVDLGTFASNGGYESEAYAVSADGSVVVGESASAGFRWTQATGLQTIPQWMAENGVSMPARFNNLFGTSGNVAIGVSADGNVVIGEHFYARVGGCDLSMIPAYASFSSAGGSGSVSFPNSSCSWTATSNSPWITITSGNSGTGAGSIQFSVGANATGAVRKGTITIAGQTYSVIQGTTSYVEKIGIYANGNWYLDGTADGVWNGAALDQTAYFGFAGAVPVRGDWDGNGIPRIGVYADGYWYLDMNADGAWNGADVDRAVHFGFPGASPVVGDWNNTGATKIGVYANGHWYLDVNGNGVWDGEPTDRACHFGFPGAVPVTGHWGGAGPDRIGVYANGYWYLDMDGDCVWNGANDAQRHFGFAGALPVTGDWNDTGISKIGVYADGYWYLDVNGNGAWDGNGTDASYYFGFPGAVPLSGSW